MSETTTGKDLTRSLYGRRVITTPVDEINAKNICDVISNAYITHLINANEIRYLYEYYKGKQPILERKKPIRPEIMNCVVENRANAIVTFKVGYCCGKPIQYISSISDENASKVIAQLNDMMRASCKPSLDKQLVEWLMICGTAYRLVLGNKDATSKIPFKLYTLDPHTTFVVYSNDYEQRPLAGVTYKKDLNGNVTFSVYTDKDYYTLTGTQPSKIVSHETHRLGAIPIVEYPANNARLGAFEIVLPLLDCLNNLGSNRIDSIEQFVQSLIVLKNCALEEGTTANDIRQAGMILLKSMGDVQADVDIIAESLDQTSTQTLKDDIIKAINEIAGIPNQSDGTGFESSNNGAVYLKQGWQGAETRAQDFETMFKQPEQKTLGLVATLCEGIEGLSFDPMGVEVKFTRRNFEDILSKSQTLTTMLQSNLIHPKCAYEASGMFVDTEDAYRLGMEWYAQKQAEAEELMQKQTEQAQDEQETDDGEEDAVPNRRTEQD